MFALAKPCLHGFWTPWMASVGDPVMMRSTWPLSFRKSTVVASIRVRGRQSFLRGFYGNPTLRAMHSIHKCVAKNAPHLLAVLRNEPRVTFKLLNLQPSLDQAPGIVHTASMDGKSFFHDRTFCCPADIVLGMGQSAAFMSAEGMNGLP